MSYCESSSNDYQEAIKETEPTINRNKEMQHQDARARGDLLTAARLQSEQSTTSGLPLKCPWSEQEGCCPGAGSWDADPAFFLCDTAGRKHGAKGDEPGLKGSAGCVDVTLTSSGDHENENRALGRW